MPGSLNAARESAREYCAQYKMRALAAEELIELRERENNVVLVDVRTAPERRVSRIKGSLSTREFEALSFDALRNQTVVCYCTVGKRSGDYATALAGRDNKPWRHLFNSEGIVPYSHHPEALSSSSCSRNCLVDEEGAAATKIHVFAFRWDLASDAFAPVQFGPLGALAAAIAPSLLE